MTQSLLGWHVLPCDHVLNVSRTRRGGRTPRFFVLGPLGGERFRPLVAAGDLVDAQAVIDHGELSTEHLEAIAEIVRAASAEVPP